MKITVLSGGVGAAKFLRGLVAAVPADAVTAVVNTGDDTELHGLAISPDLDTITYTLAEATDTERGWGLSGETCTRWRHSSGTPLYAPRARRPLRPGSTSATTISPPTSTERHASRRAPHSPRSRPRSRVPGSLAFTSCR